MHEPHDLSQQSHSPGGQLPKRSQGLGSRNWFHKGTQKKAAVKRRCQHSYRYLTATFHPLDLLYLWGKKRAGRQDYVVFKNSSYLSNLVNAVFWSTGQQTKPARERFQRGSLKMLGCKILFFSVCDLDVCLEHTLRRPGHVYV